MDPALSNDAAESLAFAIWCSHLIRGLALPLMKSVCSVAATRLGFKLTSAERGIQFTAFMLVKERPVPPPLRHYGESVPSQHVAGVHSSSRRPASSDEMPPQVEMQVPVQELGFDSSDHDLCPFKRIS